MNSLLPILYKWILSLESQKRAFGRKFVKGFTLIELLISLIIAGLVMSGLLYAVVELTTIDQRESNLDRVQRDMTRALDYIVDDIQEAVYVYPDPAFIADQLTADSAFPGDETDGEVPVLAFWRIDPLEENIPKCDNPPLIDDRIADCNLLEIRQAAYTLVVYVQKINDGTNSNWSGQSRIIRYELEKYSDLSILEPRGGYRDPTDSEDELAPFAVWQVDGTPVGNSDVLVDYVQRPVFDTPVALNREPLGATAAQSCSSYGSDNNGTPLYTVAPANATTEVNNTFFACVRNPNIAGVNNNRNQDVYIFLRGNVQGTRGGVRGYGDRASLPILETQVLVRGVINKVSAE